VQTLIAQRGHSGLQCENNAIGYEIEAFGAIARMIKRGDD
jgi:hypothetical protein